MSLTGSSRVSSGYLVRDMCEWAQEEFHATDLPKSSWERANADSCTKAIANLGEQTDLFAQSKKHSPAVNAVLDYLKAGKYIRSAYSLRC